MSQLTAILVAILLFGVNTSFWALVGTGRYATARSRRLWRQQRLRPRHRSVTAVHHFRRLSLPRLSIRRTGAARRHLAQTQCSPSVLRATGLHAQHRFRSEDVAVLIPAHNEAAVLENTVRAASTLLPLSNIHVVSDGSTDRTAEVAREFGVHVLELLPNRGKAGALLAAIRHFELSEHFRVMLLLDADTRLASDYLDTGLPEFDDGDVVAVAGYVRCLLDPPPRTLLGRFLVAYRARLYVVAQLLNKYGQAARWANVVSIVPGFASMYRTDVLDQIDIAAPGLVIEDFNMTFEVHAKNLGRIAFRPGTAIAYTQDPDTPHDYVRQIRRWSLGFWQTVRLHRFRLGRFWFALAAQIVELISGSVLLLLMLPLLMFAVYSDTLAETCGNPEVMGRELVATVDPQYVLAVFLLPDLLITVVAAIALRRPTLLLLAPLLPALRLVDAYVCLRSIPTACRTRSNGTWISPARREAEKDTSVIEPGDPSGVASHRPLVIAGGGDHDPSFPHSHEE